MNARMVWRIAAALALVGLATPAPALTRPEVAGKVAPGLVHWHSNYRGALAASAASGKPVLLFVMLGNLDDEFC